MAEKNIIKEELGFKLLEIKVTDEYNRQFRTAYEIINSNGVKIGNSFQQMKPAEKLFKRILSDLKGQ